MQSLVREHFEALEQGHKDHVLKVASDIASQAKVVQAENDSVYHREVVQKPTHIQGAD